MERSVNKTNMYGAIAHREVAALFNRLNWPVYDNHMHDAGDGDDLYLRAVSRNGFLTDSIVGAQVKGGPSFFGKRKRKLVNNEIVGWWFEETHQRHLEFWLGSSIPWLIVLCNIEERCAHWQYITEANIDYRNKAGRWRILVPKSQVLDESNAGALADIAPRHQQRLSASIQFEPAGSLDKPTLLSAFLLPRRIIDDASLRNQDEPDSLIGIAYAVSARFQDYEQLAHQFQSVPSLRDTNAESVGWRWAFAKSLFECINNNKFTNVELSIEDAETDEEIATSSIALACAKARQGHFGDAIGVLTAALQRMSESEGFISAWLHSQLARFEFEIGQRSMAAQNIEIAEATLSSLESRSSMYGAVLGPLARMKFLISGTSRGISGNTARHADTRALWWRANATASGLSNFLTESFETWSGFNVTRFLFEDKTSAGLTEALLQSDHAGNREAALESQKQLAMYTATAARDFDEVLATLTALKHAGADTELERATYRFQFTGPIDAIQRACQWESPDGWTYTNSKSNLTLLTAFGNLLPPPQAQHLITELLTAFIDGDHWFWRRISQNFDAVYYGLKAIGDLAYALDASQRVETAPLLLRVARIHRAGLGGHEMARALPGFELASLPNDQQDEWLDFAKEQDVEPMLSRQIVGELALTNNRAIAEVLAMFDRGDIEAIWDVDLQLVDKTQLERVKQHLNDQVQAVIANSKPNVFGPDDAVGIRAAWFSVKFPSYAVWNSLIEYVTHSTITGSDKRQIMDYLANNWMSVPTEIQDAIRNEGADSLEGPINPLSFSPVGDHAPSSLLRFVLGQVTVNDLMLEALSLLSQSEKRARLRGVQLLAKVVEFLPESQSVILSLLTDTDMQIRAEAARTVGTLVDDYNSAWLSSAIEQINNDSGFVISYNFVRGLRSSARKSKRREELCTHYVGHPSGLVRRLAEITLATIKQQ